MRIMLTFLLLIASFNAYAQTEVKTFKLATGELLVFKFKGGIPEPSNSILATTRGAGPAIVPEGAGFRLNWVLDLGPRTSLATLANVARVVLQEVSGKQPIELFSGAPERADDGLLIIAPGELVSRQSYPWLYTADGTIFVFRAELTRPGAKPDILLQPVLIGPEVKKQLRDGGYLR
jgi:hypothetical protein